MKRSRRKANLCIKRLREEFGESKENKCCWLAAKLSAIQQERDELVEQFVFKYKKLLHQLEKLGDKMQFNIQGVAHKRVPWIEKN